MEKRIRKALPKDWKLFVGTDDCEKTSKRLQRQVKKLPKQYCSRRHSPLSPVVFKGNQKLCDI